MAVNFDPALQPMSQANFGAEASHNLLEPSEIQPYHLGLATQLIPDFPLPSPSLQSGCTSISEATNSPTPGRLAGEPAYCSGRHCCQWTVGGYVCNNHYPSAADLDRHVATDHAGRLPNRQPSGDYHCHWAGCSKSESFGNKPKLTRHIHSHTGHKPHPCLFPGCGKGFVTKEQLKNHETTHTRTKEHICPECGKGFAVKTALTSHMNVHKGAKPYVCEECGKGFADSSNLSKHKAIHKRVAAKKHRHHVHRASVSTTASSSVFSPAPFSTGHFDHFQMPTPSVETGFGLANCAQPCYDDQCTGQFRIPCRSASPCRSVPCSDRDCNPATFEHCEVPCNLGDCEPCALPECDSCDLQHCELDDCVEDCVDPFCTEQYDSIPRFGPEESFKSVHDPLIMYPDDGFDGMQVTSNTVNDSVLAAMDEDGFRRLQDFIAEEFSHSQPHNSHLR